MNKYILFAALAISFLFTGCSKDKNNNKGNDTDESAVSIPSISTPTFSNSSWNNVIGSKALLQFDLLGQNNTVVSTIKDSVDLNHLSSYNKPLSKGVYNIYLSSKNLSIAADTFIRFNAQAKDYNVSSQQDLSLKVTSDDALITIDRNLVHDNTVPAFKPDTGAKTFKFGLNNGFYYLYVKGGIKGSVSFTSKSNQTFTKSLSVVALTQYNVALQTANGSLQITFVPFAYNQVGVNSNNLITLNINPNNVPLLNSKTYFVVTDESGNILNEVEYIKGTSSFKIAALQPYIKDRVNFFEINIPDNANTVPQITGFLQVKKGSIYNSESLTLQGKEVSSPMQAHLINASSFDELVYSTVGGGTVINSLADTTYLQSFKYYPEGSKLYLRMLKNNQYRYNFLDVPKGTLNFNVDLSQLTKTPLKTTITVPGNNTQVQVYAKTDANYIDFFLIDDKIAHSNQVDIYYPSETFQEYDIAMFYNTGNLTYEIETSGTTIPDNSTVFNASFNINASTLANFVPSWSGQFDFYSAEFKNDPVHPTLDFVLYSPSAANYTNIKLPDFSKYLSVSKLDLNSFSLKSFGLHQFEGFDETKLLYKKNGSIEYPYFKGKSVTRNYY